ncbi:hypothetical protein KL930_005328 [Ogataea haglerorum]|uniref:25S rRNA (uridine-N(3))-methyltransferase BMT5-like domain-containing protein n=1 Tax=Ogataea haglerorum TaxID=1937702 RepID=A0ABQ7RII5_9ASCO|nr:uncharacterized protein KL911_002353 [Ogataea haglerorum]KAG7696372.1 hypothetical protein KL915_002736 [Ogataea haglerorum]KAG7696744.1 hypothetical protein KL951_003200 [Ogataea haglerorum]KAG7706812.1 hypothetical protein KL914_002696 [Ogataea haglerorum]KAG7739160.1 hypothetical protein KL923_002960 [Ogataea haglerorum]KAG7747925.1 hypothetical protein KL912_002602 [Ogataea haglerorum]
MAKHPLKQNKPPKVGGGKLKSALMRYHTATNKKHSLPFKEGAETKTKNLIKHSKNNIGNSNATAYKYLSKPFIPFGQSDNLLLVGEGDFSFTQSIVNAGYVKPSCTWATSLDSEDDVYRKYPHAREVIESIRSSGVHVVFNIDATQLVNSFKLSSNVRKQAKRNVTILGTDHIDLIMFNFPHTGKGIKDIARNVIYHQKLIYSFFKSCSEFFSLLDASRIATLKISDENSGRALREPGDGTPRLLQSEISKKRIALALFEGEPYDSWQVKRLAKESINYKVERSGRFAWEAFGGYHHRRTNSMKGTTKNAHERNARLYVFEKAANSNTQDVRGPEKVGSDSE